VVRTLTVGVDVDDVVADLCSAWLTEYNARWNDTLREWPTWELTDVVKPECGAQVYDILKWPVLYDRVSPIAGALWGVQKIRAMGHRVLFITSCGYDPDTISASSGAKLRWLQRYGFLPEGRGAVEDFVIAAEKRLVKADLLIDDRASTIGQWGTRGVLFTRPHNTGYHHWPRVSDWGPVPDLVEQYARYGENVDPRVGAFLVEVLRG